ncbi:Tight junction-associated protein 1 [Zootermopsis nevadensis]|uniref:Tight junction-associated protein 1 n=1 Tax=Zootermopsis nevadensis TaxID=136037 RepID=A0A067R2Q6_ZOONE|nr:Tight junction-associated protein 1 [Zootermopsis nevadensis]
MMAQRTITCKECGWSCKNCSDQTNLHLHVEIENLKQRILEREHHIVNMETNFLTEAEKFPNGEFAALAEELLTWQEKYSRLYESHKRVQKVNQNLEDKLLKIVDKCETEKNSLTRDVTSLTQKLVEAKGKICHLQDENERYRNDVNLAIQLLQCKPANFVSHKFDMLPADLQQKVRTYVSSKRRPSDGNSGTTAVNKSEPKIIKVPIPTFPPTAMVYSINKVSADKDEDCHEKSSSSKPPVDIVSAAIMAKVLEERERERLNIKHCDSCTCPRQGLVDCATQATPIMDHAILCVRCATNVRSRSDSASSTDEVQQRDGKLTSWVHSPTETEL